MICSRPMLLALLALGGCIIVPVRRRTGPPPPPPGDDRTVNGASQQPPPPPDNATREDDERPVAHQPPPPRKPPPRTGKNPFPELGEQISDEQWREIPDYDRDKQYTYGAIVKEGYSSEPHTIVYRCGQEKCEGSPSGNGWVNAGWY